MSKQYHSIDSMKLLFSSSHLIQLTHFLQEMIQMKWKQGWSIGLKQWLALLNYATDGRLHLFQFLLVIGIVNRLELGEMTFISRVILCRFPALGSSTLLQFCRRVSHRNHTPEMKLRYRGSPGLVDMYDRVILVLSPITDWWILYRISCFLCFM